MSEYTDMIFCELQPTPFGFDVDKFKAGDKRQLKLYQDGKKPYNRTVKLTYEQVTDAKKPINYAREVPKRLLFYRF